MKKQTLVWNALPNGVVGAGEPGGPRLRLSVYMAPRLQTDEGGARPTLAQFPDLLDWPGAMAGVRFTVRFDHGPTVPADQVTVVAAPPDPVPSALWRAVFPSNTYVRPYVFPSMEDHVIVSFPVRNVQETIGAVYESVAVESPLGAPEITNPGRAELGGLRDFINEVGMAADARVGLAAQVGQYLQGQQFKALMNVPAAKTMSLQMPAGQGPAGAQMHTMSLRMGEGGTFNAELPQVAMDFQQVAMFHSVAMAAPQRGAARRSVSASAAALANEHDFHEIVGALGQFPSVMRRLGLVIDLEVPYQAGMDAATAVRVVPQFAPQMASTGVTPRTRCRVRADSFVSLSREECGLETGESIFRDGMLRLDDAEGFDVGQVDVDAAALQAVDYADSMKPVVAAAVTAAPVGAAPPAAEASSTQEASAMLPVQRTSGIWVARVNRARELATKALPRAIARQSAVQRLETKFAPTIAAQGAAAPLAVPTTEAEDSSLELFTEDLVRGYRVDVWDDTTSKWHSLCQRVGSFHFLRGASGGAAAVDETVGDVHEEGWVSSGARTTDEDGTKTLFLHEIMFRWDGWSLAASRPDKPLREDGVADATPGVRGLDTAFVPEPRTLPRLRFGREYRLRARTVDLAGNGVGPESTSDAAASEPLVYTRYEPVGSPVLVARSVLDNAPGETVEKIVLRSENEVKTPDGEATQASAASAADAVHNDEWNDRHVAPPKVAEMMAELHGKLDATTGMMADHATYQMLLDHDHALAENYDSDTFDLPYLADPLAEGAVVRVTYPLSDNPAQVFRIPVPFSGTWPMIAPFRVRVVEPQGGAGAPVFDEATRVLLLPLPKAQTAKVTISSYMPEARVADMAHWHTTTRAVVRSAVATRGYKAADIKIARRDLPNMSKRRQAAGQLGLSAADRKQLDDLAQIANSGANMLLTPSRDFVVVHAVQQPLGLPVLGQMASARDYGQTFASLIGRLKLDGKSAAKADIQASWSEMVDDVSKPGPETYHSRQHVWDLSLEPTDKETFIHIPGTTLVPGTGLSIGELQRQPEVLDPGRFTTPIVDPNKVGPIGPGGPGGPGGPDPGPDVLRDRGGVMLEGGAAGALLNNAGALQNNAGALQNNAGALQNNAGALQNQPGALKGNAAGGAMANAAGENVAAGASTAARVTAGPAARAVAARNVAGPSAAARNVVAASGLSAAGRALSVSRYATAAQASDAALVPGSLWGDLPTGVPRRHEFGDTHYRRVNYTAIASTRFRECFPFSDDDIAQGREVITRTSQAATVDIMSSARPAAPRVLYVIPTFGWEKGTAGAALTSRRTAGGLRVYLERPWFSSGDGELLGVVIPHLRAGSGVDPRHSTTYSWMDTMKPFVSQMGGDPIWRSEATTAWPLLSDFPRAKTSEGDLTLDELWADGKGVMSSRRDLRVAVAGHEVAYDEERRLWYADIEINPHGSYFPFVRLALVRYQPNSVVRNNHDVKLSRVVQADFAQLAPGRLATVTPVNARTMNVVVGGVGYIGSATRAQPSTMQVLVQTRPQGSTDEFTWHTVADSTAVLNASRVVGQAGTWSWQGSVTLPADRGSLPFRLVLQEFEVFEADADSPEWRDVPGTNGAAAVVDIHTDRLVYADVFEL
jgi:hypothetical protein